MQKVALALVAVPSNGRAVPGDVGLLRYLSLPSNIGIGCVARETNNIMFQNDRSAAIRLPWKPGGIVLGSISMCL
jgi:hypothetical protein